MMKASPKEKEYKEIIKRLQELEERNGVYDIMTIFQDFILMITIAIKNTYDYNEEDQEKYIEIAKKYKEEEIMEFDKLLVLLTKIYTEQKEIHDVLGQIYKDLKLENKINNNFFLPLGVANVLSGVTIDNEIDKIQENLKKKDFISIYNSNCNSGTVILNFIERTKLKIENYLEKIVFTAEDTDINCICMTFIQLTMNKIPAQIVLKKRVSKEIIKILYTPEFVKGNWLEKLKNMEKER